ncbi:MAG: ATP-dependent protease ATPase subunit HslU [Planctomycetaceae bacterium]|jgi:ATP-dependent HslUV protease ATP-binding subunit HslU|nr:ATP-dependent protease ATPase subunit HslU [Planctomycetaceae bacterium]
MRELTPRQIVTELDRFIVGQNAAKRSVAIAVRNRWRRQHVDPAIQSEIAPKNILMIGPTGVGKTEIARRLATLTGAPFLKVEATKYTEVGYYGRDVESMVRELVENAIGLVRAKERAKIQEEAEKRTEERLIDLLAEITEEKNKETSTPTASCQDEKPEETSTSPENDFLTQFSTQLGKILPPGVMSGTLTFPAFPQQPPREKEPEESAEKKEKKEEILEEIRGLLRAGELENEKVTVFMEAKGNGMPMMMGIGGDLDNLQDMIEKIMPKRSQNREMSVREARTVIFEQESEKLINKEKVDTEAVELAENFGIIFIDEIDKVVAGEKTSGADVSRQGVQRDLLPIVEGTTVQTRYGYVKTDHILFIAAGAFHKSRPSDLMPELQGRFPIRVELQDLTQEDFVRILTEPKGALTTQYIELLKTEGIKLSFQKDAIEKLAAYAFEVNQTSQNIGARRLATIMERLLEELSFDAPDMNRGDEETVIDAAYVVQRLEVVAQDEDMSRFIL